MAVGGIADKWAEFVMSFVEDAEDHRSPLEDVWDQLEANFLVRSQADSISANTVTERPLMTSGDRSPGRGFAVLKDPETHAAVMTHVSGIVLGAMGEPGFIKAKGVGFEDVFKGTVVNRLVEYALRMPGSYWTFVQWVVNAAVYGTGVMEIPWHYEEQPRNFRSVRADPRTGEQSVSNETLIVPTYNDPMIRLVDLRDFYPDVSSPLISRMMGCAKRFTITADEALDNVDRFGWDKDEVDEAIKTASKEDTERSRRLSSDDETMGVDPQMPFDRFLPIVGYEYYGSIPEETDDQAEELAPDDGIFRRKITVLGGRTVNNEAWPRGLPFFDCKLMPRFNSFWGYSPAEAMKYDQDFADMMKMMMADAVVRSVHAQPIVDRNANIPLHKLRQFHPDVPIVSDRIDGVRFLEYNPPLQHAFGMYQGIKGQMREASGAVDVLQGLGLGSKRSSASEFVGTVQAAKNRPELFTSLIEREMLPPIGKYILSMYQEFLDSDEEVRLRVGESTHPVGLSDILADFDIEFVGSRQEGNRNESLAAFREIAAAAASNPIILHATPWLPLLRKWFDGLGAHEIAAMVGNEQLMQLHIALTQIAGPGGQLGNGNGEQQAKAPIGALPAQTFGGTQ